MDDPTGTGPVGGGRRRGPTQAVILAGGRGSRLRPITDVRPKAMVEFHGKPFLAYLVEMLRDQGFERILLLLGYMADAIVNYFEDGHRFGIRIEYSVSAPEDLTARRVELAESKIEEHFLLMYCDNYWPMRIDDMWAQYVASGAPAQITVYSNKDGYSRDSVIVGEGGRVEVFDRDRATPGLQGVEIGYAILSREVLDLLPSHQELFEQAVYPALAERHDLHAYWTDHCYYSVGSHERLPLTEAFLARRRTVILDRDGVLNVRPPRAEYVRTPQEFQWLPGALEALRMLHEASWRVILVSNQAGIGRGEMSADDLAAVHARMLADVHAAGGRIEGIYHCPHDWDDGCDCRKPRPGMLFRAQRDHVLDLTRTLFIGDDERDAQAGRAAGCPVLLVSEDRSLLDIARTQLLVDLQGAAS
jgi:D-glycero-D-manno-heptose 1,7-bisphosphate phosphatase